MIRYGELDQAITVYTRVDVHEIIPAEYYRRVMKIAIKMNNEGKHWDMQQSAAILLYLAFTDEHLQPSQLSAEGLEVLDYAEKLMLDDVMEAELGVGEVDASFKVMTANWGQGKKTRN
ncbi:MAG: hypothetical protein KAT90_11665 [Gammaproteobacteria bacterium]|nr:hypothetical protein [Gammaproteobacteria bacterium]